MILRIAAEPGLKEILTIQLILIEAVLLETSSKSSQLELATAMSSKAAKEILTAILLLLK